MAIMDSKLEFSDAQVISASSASTVNSTNVVYLGNFYTDWLKELGTTSGATTPNIGEASDPTVVIQIATALNASAYIVAKAYHHTTSAVTSGATFGTATFSAADAAGTRKTIKVPTGTINKYVGLQYSTVGSNMTTGAVDAWLEYWGPETPTV